MKTSDFYILRSKLSSKTFQAQPVDLSIDFSRLVAGKVNDISFPLIFKQSTGKTMTDMLDTGMAYLYLISEKFKQLLTESNLTGWKLFPVKVLNTQNEEIEERYYGLSIIGRCGPINYDEAEIVELRYVPDGPVSKHRKGFGLGLESWDNTDLFLPDKYFGTILTSHAQEVLSKAKLTNVTITNVSDIETPEYVVDMLKNK